MTTGEARIVDEPGAPFGEIAEVTMGAVAVDARCLDPRQEGLWVLGRVVDALDTETLKVLVDERTGYWIAVRDARSLRRVDGAGDETNDAVEAMLAQAAKRQEDRRIKMAEKKTTTKRTLNVERDARIVELRKDGKTYAEIGTEVGLSTARVRGVLKAESPELVGSREETTERDAKVVELRRTGKSFADAGREVGISGARARGIVKRDAPELLGRIETAAPAKAAPKKKATAKKATAKKKAATKKKASAKTA